LSRCEQIACNWFKETEVSGFSITIDSPPFGVSSAFSADAAAAAKSAIALLDEGRTIYVSTPDGEILSGDEFIDELAQGRYA
jgi:hypothetical protein